MKRHELKKGAVISFYSRPGFPLRFRRAVADAMVISLLTIGLFVHVHPLELHAHAPEPASKHAQVLCTLMCAAGHGVPALLWDAETELTPLYIAEAWLVEQLSSVVLLSLVTRGLPSDRFSS